MISLPGFLLLGGNHEAAFRQKAGGFLGEQLEVAGMPIAVDLILRSALLRASRRMRLRWPSWFETREDALLTMRKLAGDY
jgi:hypothetical protein